MSLLKNYLEKQLLDRLERHRVLVWYDPRSEFAAFVRDFPPAGLTTNETRQVRIGDRTILLLEYRGSFLALRMAVEPFVNSATPEFTLIYIPGAERDEKGSLLKELELAGDCYEPQLKRMARHAFQLRYTDGLIDEMLAPEALTYDDLATVVAESGNELPSVLKRIFPDHSPPDPLLIAWLSSADRDEAIIAQEATAELRKLILSRLGLDLPVDYTVAKMRRDTARFLLISEFCGDLAVEIPGKLKTILTVTGKNEEKAARDLIRKFRDQAPVAYAETADRIESDLGLRDLGLPASALGSIDTFRFEEAALLGHCAQLITGNLFEEAEKIVRERENCFWINLDKTALRKNHWEAIRLMAELGRLSSEVSKTVRAKNGDAERWLAAYTDDSQGQAWYRLDRAQRRLETLLAEFIEEEPDGQALNVVRRQHLETCQLMAEGFTRRLVAAGWNLERGFPQARIQPDFVQTAPKPIAYFLVDAMRYEMGVDLVERLPTQAEWQLRAAVCTLPSITPMGMAALLPGAAASYSVVAQNGKLGARIEGTFLPDVATRNKFHASRIPNLVDMTLDDLLSLSTQKLKKKVEGASVVVVRSQEIDAAGENVPSHQAHTIMNQVIDHIIRGMRKLAHAGIENSVITADHGHFFHSSNLDDSQKIDPPKGETVELHRRCWIGKGGATPAACVRVSAANLGYDSDLEFVFPTGIGVFRSGGDLSFHHGGCSLQELVIPVITVRQKKHSESLPKKPPVNVSGLPPEITNRMFSITLSSLLANTYRIGLFMQDRKVGDLFGAVGGEQVDRDNGTIRMAAGGTAAVALLLKDDEVKRLRVIISDPEADVELWRSDELDVKLGV